MKTFSDNSGRSWGVTINVGAVKRVRDACGVNLLDAVGGTLIQQLIDDPVLLADIVYCLCKEAADAGGDCQGMAHSRLQALLALEVPEEAGEAYPSRILGPR
jgi:hypothetical protein